jgi:tetratricopeptide (TPR) repeat protein
LTTEERRVVQDASVLGKTFTKSGLVAISGLSEPELELVLSALVRKEVLNLQADPRSPERGQYGFLQDLLKRVAYETLSRKERRTLHLAAAEHLTEAFEAAEQEIVEVVAAHYVSAYEAAPDADDATEIRRKAHELLARAAERAASLAAGEEAQRYFEQAANLAADPLEQARMLERSGEMAWIRGRAEEARDRLEQAIELFEQRGESHAAARVSARLGEVEWRGGQLEQAIERMERAFEVLVREEPDQDLAELAAQLGRLHWFHGDVERAAERVETALEIAETLWLPEVVAQALITKAIVADTQGRSEESLALLKHALEVARENDLPAAMLRAYHNLGDTLARRDRYAEALESFRSAVALGRRAGNVQWQVTATSEIAVLLALTGAPEEALETMGSLSDAELEVGFLGGLACVVPPLLVPRGALDQARALLERFARFEASDDVQERSAHSLIRASIARAEGRNAEALACAEQALADLPLIGAAAQPMKDTFVEALEASLALGDLDKVRELLARIDALRPRERTPFYRAHASRFRARLAIAAGTDGDVEADFEEAARLFQEYGVPFWLAVTQLERGEWLVADSRQDEAEPLLAEARAIFERLEAKPWTERVDRVSGREQVPA